MRGVYVLLIASLAGCATDGGGCNYAAKPAACADDGSIDFENGALILRGPTCSTATVMFGDGRTRTVKNPTGHQWLAPNGNEECNVVAGSCRAYPEQK